MAQAVDISPEVVRSEIIAQAKSLGFDAVGFTRAETTAAVREGLLAFVADGRQGSMDWLRDRIEERLTPANLWNGAKGAVMLAMNYAPKTDPRTLLDHPSHGNISVYARGRDYHDIVKSRLKALGRWMGERYGCGLKVFVDTAPVAEKPLAAQAGLGWQGKHTNLVSREFGSWLFLGAILTDMVLGEDTPHKDHCGACTACLEACPTAAFTGPGKIDARRCISYLTIEHKGPIPEEFRKPMGNRIYGCDDCLAACPWNKFASVAREAGYHARVELAAPHLADLIELDDAGFRQVFAGSPIKRIGRDRFIRNVLIAVGNSGDASLLPKAKELANDPADVVADAARWAVKELEGET